MFRFKSYKLVRFVVFIFLFIFLIKLCKFKNNDESGNVVKSFQNILDCSQLKIDPVNNIFFVETSGVEIASKPSNLKVRQACAVESAAALNPNSNIFVVFVSDFGLSDSSAMEVLKTFKNVFFVHLDLLVFTKNTPVEKWMREGKIYQTKFLRSNISNILKVLLLWR